jgi:predicted nucleic acid-binding protein
MTFCLNAVLLQKAGLLITSDKNLLETEKLPFALEIVTPREFIEKF